MGKPANLEAEDLDRSHNSATLTSVISGKSLNFFDIQLPPE